MNGKPNTIMPAKESRTKAVASPVTASRARATLADRLLGWYDRHRRVLPWRAPAGKRADPYRVWISEIMLQQTTVVTAGPYFQSFLARFPDVAALAAAPVEDVMHAWSGLGYYARARNLHKAAQVLVADFDGRLPQSEEDLLSLPGIGVYTAAAIRAIAFDKPAAAVDGNAERVIARLYAIDEPMPGAKRTIRERAATVVPQTRAGDFAQALMDLGSGICTPAAPKCMLCPVSDVCEARVRGITEALPTKAAKSERQTRRGVAFWIVDPAGRVLLRRRPPSGLLGGMMEVPSSAWEEGRFDRARAMKEAPLALDYRLLGGSVRHVFSHFALDLVVAVADAPKALARMRGTPYAWREIEKLSDEALPSVMMKVVSHALGESAKPASATPKPAVPSSRSRTRSRR